MSSQEYIHVVCMIITIILSLNIINGSLFTKPSDQTVTVGSEARLECSTTSPGGVTWKHAPAGISKPDIVYSDGKFINGYASRFRVEDPPSGKYDLILTNIQLDDGGVYSCVDDNGRGEIGSATLTVKIIWNEPFEIPSDSTVLIGQTVRFSFRSAYLKNVFWYRQDVKSQERRPVYYGKIGFVNGFKSSGRHFVNPNDTSGQYDLVITKVQAYDAGKYICVDKGGAGPEYQAELTVLETLPRCSTETSSDVIVSCGPHKSKIKSTCEVRFNGTNPPELSWRRQRDSDETDIETGLIRIEKSPNSVVASLSTSDYSTDDTFVCVVKNGEELRCSQSLMDLKLIHIPNSTKTIQLTTKENIVCSAGTKLPCNYSWIRNKDDIADHHTIFEGEQLNLEEPGSYSCKATCNTSAQKCIVYPMQVEYVLKTHNDSKNEAVVVIVVILSVLIILTAIISSAGIFLLWRRKQSANCGKEGADSRSEKYALHDHGESTILKAFVVWKGKLYAIFKGVNYVDEYTCQPPFHFKRTIPVEGMKNPVDIASCSKFNRLYVTDEDGQCVWKISFSSFRAIGNISKIISNIEFPSTLKISVTPLGKLVLVENCELADGKKVSRSSVNIYDENGTLEKIYHVPADNEPLKHAVLNNQDRFVVSFGGRLGILDKLENITARYPISGSPAFDKEEAWHVVIDDHDRTFLTNFKNKEIIVLDKDLHELSKLDISTVSSDPPSCYTVYMNKIYIGLLSGNILVTDIKAVAGCRKPVELSELLSNGSSNV